LYKLPGVALTQHTPVVSKQIFHEIVYNKHKNLAGVSAAGSVDIVLQIMKRQYYLDFFQIDITTPAGLESLQHIVTSYITGLKWCLNYYLCGVPSWTYYYPYYYAPLLSDLKGLSMRSNDITFELGAPLQPFQQLAVCLSSISSYLLPSCYTNVMNNPQSPVS